MGNQRNDLDVIQIIEREFEETIPFIHKESKGNYVLIQITQNGIVRIQDRVPSQELARKKVNEFIARMKSHPAATNHTE